ncbi:MAG: HAD hydrolase-like protein [Lachnospiraceae bacterium]|nr:HAD hydrolase-like protein [Lachnospiraceae bacterium]
MKIKAVIFDLDDTLVSEYAFVKSGFKAVAKHLTECKEGVFVSFAGSNGDILANEFLSLFDESAKNVFNRFLDAHGVSGYMGDDIFSLVKVYREHEIDREIYKPYDDVEPFLSALKDRGIAAGILTDGFAVSQRNKIKTLGFDVHPAIKAAVVTAEHGEGWVKPSAKGFELLCDELNVRPQEMMYVGDNPKKDFYISRNIPIKTVRIIRGGGVYENAPYFEDVREDHRIEKLEELYAFI